METESTEAAVDTPTTSEAAPTASEELTGAMDAYLSGDEAESNEVTDGDPANAPEEGNPTEPEKAPDAPETEVPESTEDQPAEAKPDETEGEPAKEEEKSEEDDLLNELLEVEPEPDLADVSVLQKRYSDATRHIGELTDKQKQLEEVLASQGRQLVQTKDGLKIAATDDAPELNAEAVDVGKLFSDLTPDEQDLFTDSPEKAAQLVADKVREQIAEKFMPVEASEKDVILSQGDVDGVYDDFVNSKLRDGTTPRFRDADNPEVVDLMKKAYDSKTPAMEKFKDLANRDKDIQHVLLEYLYNKGFRARHAKLSVLAAKKAATAEIKEKIKQEPTVSTQGASQQTNAQTSSSQAAGIEARVHASLESGDFM